MADLIPVTVLPVARTFSVEPGTTVLRGAHAHGVDITATCGGRGRCTSCRVKFMAGAPPPGTIMDALQLGEAQVREGYRLACQIRVNQAMAVQVAPPLVEHTFQILGAGKPEGMLSGIEIDAGVRKQVVKVALPREEHHQTSDLEELLAATGAGSDDVSHEVLRTLPAALREHHGEV